MLILGMAVNDRKWRDYRKVITPQPLELPPPVPPSMTLLHLQSALSTALDQDVEPIEGPSSQHHVLQLGRQFAEEVIVPAVSRAGSWCEAHMNRCSVSWVKAYSSFARR